MQKLKRIPYIVSLILLAYMPFHVFLSQSLSLATGGLEAWKVWKDVLLAIACLFTICLVWWQRKGTRVFNWLVLFAAAYGALHLILWAVHPDIYDRSAIVGIIYNMRLPLFLLLGYGAALLLPKFAFSSVLKVALIVGTIVAGLGVLQYFLPPDILSHLGYSLERGARVAFFIDDNPEYLRIMSTLREPNALGAYLILPATALTLLFIKAKDINKRYVLAGALALHLLAIFLTFSRSAWLATAVAGALVLWWSYRDWITAKLKRFWPIAAATVLAVVIGLFSISNTQFFQQYVIHSNPQEQVVDLDSNDYHTLLIKQGLAGIRDEPLGHGPGTAGLASIQNPNGGQLTENYYIQIGYEVGLVGLALFVGLNIWLYVRIWRRHDLAALVLCASFWAYIATNMLLHTWSNEAVAAQWWLLAGMALASKVGAPPVKKSAYRSGATKTSAAF